MPDRRSFLSDLAKLPLIGGGVTLIGQPTAAAVPVTDHLLSIYETWLDLEKSWLRWERYGSIDHRLKRDAEIACVWYNRRTKQLHDSADIYDPRQRLSMTTQCPRRGRPSS